MKWALLVLIFGATPVETGLVFDSLDERVAAHDTFRAAVLNMNAAYRDQVSDDSSRRYQECGRGADSLAAPDRRRSESCRISIHGDEVAGSAGQEEVVASNSHRCE